MSEDSGLSILVGESKDTLGAGVLFLPPSVYCVLAAFLHPPLLPHLLDLPDLLAAKTGEKLNNLSVIASASIVDGSFLILVCGEDVGTILG